MNLCCTILTIAFAFWLGNIIASPIKNVPSAEELEQRREQLRNMTKDVWQGYLKEKINAQNISKDVKVKIVVNIMSTLWTMGLKEEFAQGREWINANLGNVSQTNARGYVNDFADGLLSCYALTNDTMFRDKAFEMAGALQPGYDNQTGLSNSIFVPRTHVPSKIYGLSDFGGSMLVERYLHSLAPEQFPDRTSRWRAFLRNQIDSNSDTLFGGINYRTGIHSGINSSTGTFSGDTRSLTNAQLFYANLVKGYAQSNGTDLEAIELYVKAIETAVQLRLFTSANGLNYIQDYRIDTNQFENFIYYKGCVFGALLQIGADALEAIRVNNQTIASKTSQQLTEIITQHRMLADQITETCHLIANQTKPLPFLLFINELDSVDSDPNQKPSWWDQRFDSGLEESYFILWRATKDPKYRDYAWELTQAYAEGNKSNLHYELLSKGFKCLYLAFSDDSVLPLDQWVFTPKGHPLPICGHNGGNNPIC